MPVASEATGSNQVEQLLIEKHFGQDYGRNWRPFFRGLAIHVRKCFIKVLLLTRTLIFKYNLFLVKSQGICESPKKPIL